MASTYSADQALNDLQEQFKSLDHKNPEHQKKMQNLIQLDDRPGSRCLCALSLSRPRATAF